MQLGEIRRERVADLRNVKTVGVHMPFTIDKAIIVHGLDTLIEADTETDAIHIVASRKPLASLPMDEPGGHTCMQPLGLGIWPLPTVAAATTTARGRA